MIHHLSVPAGNPLHVARVLTELYKGTLTGFGPYPDSYIAWMGDTHGSAIEVYPAGTEMYPDEGVGQAQFRATKSPSGFTATHAAVSVQATKDEIFAIARREGWRAIELSRGSNMVVEFWIENRVMLELMTPDMTSDYTRASSRFFKVKG